MPRVGWKAVRQMMQDSDPASRAILGGQHRQRSGGITKDIRLLGRLPIGKLGAEKGHVAVEHPDLVVQPTMNDYAKLRRERIVVAHKAVEAHPRAGRNDYVLSHSNRVKGQRVDAAMSFMGSLAE